MNEESRVKARQLCQGLAYVVATGVLAAGCGSQTAESQTTVVGSKSYIYELIRANRETLHSPFDPRTLAKALPNQEYIMSENAKEGQAFRFSTMAVVGDVESVVKGRALAHTGEDTAKVVDFDDPSADEQTVVVTLQVLQSTDADSEDVSFEMGLLNSPDPELFIAILRSFDRIFVLLNEVDDGYRAGTLVRALTGGPVFGEVSEDGSITLPGMGPEASRFLSSVDTVDEVLSVAKAPGRLQVVSIG